jgi:hypothetical protein
MSGSILATTADYPLHLLGWKSFQDLCVSVAEECLRRPVQNFLPSNDAGRDGAFVGRWDGTDLAAGESTIQCKFTSRADHHLSMSMLEDELEKARALAGKGLAADYVILTNHPLTGASELQIKTAFQAVGVGRCRVFGYDWIIRQIRSSPRLRMMAPRLYGLGDLSELLDARAYAQAKLILSAMGDDLQRLVVTEAHRKSVRAISAHNLVLLLGAPATGKSTIGASLAVGAADIWQCATIRVTSPEDIKDRLSPGTQQFFWVDDAWGNTQYQRQTTEAWNQIFPLMRGAMQSGTRFLLTSRDYIWNAAQRDLKVQALPVLHRSQVVINVQDLTTQEKAQILYNHLKLGDQPKEFRTTVKPHLPEIAERRDFLPETARRLGSQFFAADLSTSREAVLRFFAQPADFLLETIRNLSADCRAAIAVVFMNGGKIRSPVPVCELEPASSAFGVASGAARDQLEPLNGSLLLLAQDEMGPFWTYKHPTVSDAFARYVAGSPELVEIYLLGARPESIVHEVVCAGCEVYGAAVIVPDSFHSLLADRIGRLEVYQLASFISYRSNRNFSQLMLERRPEILNRLSSFYRPIKEDPDASLLATLCKQGLLSEKIRLNFVEELRRAAVEEADSSFLDNYHFEEILTEEERDEILLDVEREVVRKFDAHVDRLREEWSMDSEPQDYFDEFRHSMKLFVGALSYRADHNAVLASAENKISYVVARMYEDYEPGSSTSAPTASSTPQTTPLLNLFRDVDE